MRIRMEPDWTLLRSFLAVAETGSLSAAARTLGQTQPTIGRHIAALERQLSTALFTRALRGMALTEAGAALVPAAREMRAAAARLSRMAEGQGDAVSGTVRLTASRIVSHFLLPAMIADLRQQEPGIEVEIVPSDTTENLLFREADIALRMYRPTQADVVTRHVTDLALGLYAAPAQLAREGVPRDLAALGAMTFVGFDRSDLMLRTMAGLGVNRTRTDFPVRCDDQVIYWNLGRAGCGIVAMQRVIGDADPYMARIADFLPLPALPVWLTVPEPLRHNPRIRRVLSYLAQRFGALDPARTIG